MAVPEANSQPDADRVPLGRLLVDSGLLEAADLERVLEEQRRTGAPLGRMLVEGGYVASSTIAMALADQHGGLLKTEYGFATGRPIGTQRTARPEGDTSFDPSQLPPVDDPPADAASLPPLLLATEPTPAPVAAPASEEPRAELELALAPPPVVAPPDLPTIAVPSAAGLDPVVAVVDERDLAAGRLAAAELERDALRNRLDEAQQARRAAEQAAQASADAAQETVSVLQREADAAAAALTIARDELAAAQAQIAELEAARLEARRSDSANDHAAQESIVVLQAEAAAAAAALTETRNELDALRAERVEGAATQESLAQVREELAAARKRIEELEVARSADDDAAGSVASLQQELGTATAAFAEARAELAAAGARIAELEASRSLDDYGAGALAALQQELAAATTAAAESRSEADRLRAEHARFEDRAADVAARVQELEREVSGRDERIEQLEARLAEPSPTAATAEVPERTYADDHHVLLVPSETGYSTLERPGRAPQPGETVLLAIGRYQVSRRGASPFPDDTRGCAYLIQA
jgi:predicted  nucleic acid-binding Zn-ribbon protein